jgi:hypothetical protein
VVKDAGAARFTLRDSEVIDIPCALRQRRARFWREQWHCPYAFANFLKQAVQHPFPQLPRLLNPHITVSYASSHIGWRGR